MKFFKNITYNSEEEMLLKIADKAGKSNNNTAIIMQLNEDSRVMKYQGIVTRSPKVAILAGSGDDCIALDTYSSDTSTGNFNFNNFQLYLWAKNNTVYCIIDGRFVNLDFLALFFEPNIKNATRFLYFDGSNISQLIFDETAIKPVFDLCMNRFYPKNIKELKDETDNQEVNYYE